MVLLQQSFAQPGGFPWTRHSLLLSLVDLTIVLSATVAAWDTSAEVIPVRLIRVRLLTGRGQAMVRETAQTQTSGPSLQPSDAPALPYLV